MMPLFSCEKCQSVENTALSDYWGARRDKTPALCSECKTGIWHGQFPKQSAVGWNLDGAGFIWLDSEILNRAPHLRKMVGRVERLSGNANLT